jgi:heat-inducible transcriptional repressor
VARRIRRTNGPLDLRSQTILRAVIEQYIATATPVSSQTLVEAFNLGVSSATVRNVLAELELTGLLTHPHTSAGRTPTDAGYRYYVESIVDLAPLSPVEQLMIRHQFGQVEFASEHWFRLAAHTLATVTQAAGIATPAKPAAARIRRIDLITLSERLASLILVLREGAIKQVLLDLPAPADQIELSLVANRLNDALVGRSATEIERAIAVLEPGTPDAELLARAGERIVRVMREYDEAAVEDVYSDGLLNVLEAPEFAESEKLRRVFAALENRAWLGDVLGAVAGSGRVQVFIGRENRQSEMSDVSLILAPYGRPGQAVGVVGVLGPTRMSYPHAIGTVRFVSGLMNELVEHLYA